jgi:hypothetical protein
MPSQTCGANSLVKTPKTRNLPTPLQAIMLRLLPLQPRLPVWTRDSRRSTALSRTCARRHRTCIQHDAPLTTLLVHCLRCHLVYYLRCRHRRAPFSISMPCNLLQNYVTALRTADTALRTELLALNSALRFSKTAFATAQDYPPNLRCALAPDEGSEIWLWHGERELRAIRKRRRGGCRK